MMRCIECGGLFEHSGHHCPFCHHHPKRLGERFAFAPELAEEGEGFEASYFNRLRNLEGASFWFRARNKLLIWALRHYFPGARNFLEIGCGTGFVLSSIRNTMPDLILFGSELFTAGLSVAAKRLPEVELFQMDARRIPFENHFDVIGAFDVLEHIQDDERVLAQMHQAVRAGGGIMVSVPQHLSLWSEADEHARHVRRYSARELKAKIERGGFEILRMTSFVSLLLPPMIISRRKQSSGHEFDPWAEFKISGFTNWFLKRVMDVERAMIRLGVSFPAGGSLLVVARRI
jgi:SAM-dependent methyltransferase